MRTLSANSAKLVGVILLVIANPGSSQRRPLPCQPWPPQDPNAELPSLNLVQSAILGPSYSCGGTYTAAALALSTASKTYNGPELLFNGACGSPDYFDVNTNGDEMSLIADLGNTSIASVTFNTAFNLQNVFSFADYNSFLRVAQIVQGHTYAEVINDTYVRGLLVFTVVKFVPDKEVDIQYEVLDYQVSVGFNRSVAAQ
jgi:hypothetical protein